MFEVGPPTSRPRSEKRLVLGYVVLVCLALAHAIYNGYSEYATEISSSHTGFTEAEFSKLHYTKPLSASHAIFVGQDFAPNQYRIGVVYVAKFISDRLHLTKYYGMYAVIDFVSAVATCYCLYRLLCLSAFLLRRSRQSQSALLAFFLAMLIFPLSWVVPWERQETLPSALYLVLVLLLLRLIKNQPLWLAAILLLTLWQDIVRTDVAAVFGVAVILLSFSSYGKNLFGSRWLGLASGLLIAGVSAAAQYSLKHFIYPHAVYPPDTPSVVLYYNFSSLRSALTYSIALLPYIILLVLAWKHRKRLDPEDMVALIASVLYLPLWCIFGLLGEVRIFVPFLLALTPTAAKIMVILLDGSSPVPEVPGTPQASAASL
jgi:hypothetical protein